MDVRTVARWWVVGLSFHAPTPGVLYVFKELLRLHSILSALLSSFLGRAVIEVPSVFRFRAPGCRPGPPASPSQSRSRFRSTGRAFQMEPSPPGRPWSCSSPSPANRRGPTLPWRHLAPFFAIAFFPLLYVRRPMFVHGFRWTGCINGDMGTYAPGAVRTMNRVFRIPTLAELNGTRHSAPDFPCERAYPARDLPCRYFPPMGSHPEESC